MDERSMPEQKPESTSTDPSFYFGAMSPYSWFAAERIGGLLPDAAWRPVYAGALFKANGRSTWGLGSDREARMAECERRALDYGLGEIRWPESWPTNDVIVARALVFADRQGCLRELALTAMRMAFLEGFDLGELEAVQDAGARCGVDPTQLALAVGGQPIKDALRTANDEAVSRGVFGVPTVIVGGRLFWGDDRLDEAVIVHHRL
jgi:2-hydroxychromene-2-carboxylate isomerase